MKARDVVPTPYGDGILLLYRELDGIYKLELSYGTLFAPRTALLDKNGASSASTCTTTSTGADTGAAVASDQGGASSERTNCENDMGATYEALEKMRKLNFEVACQEKGISLVTSPSADSATGSVPTDFFENRCTTCILQSDPNNQDGGGGAHGGAKRFPRIQRLIDHQRRQNAYRKGKPCLICASPACKAHCSASFRDEGITICCDCEKLFRMDFVVECLTAETSKSRQLQMDKMLDVYDRTMLLLKYSSRYVDDIAAHLETTQVRQNKVGLGSNTAGLVSGALGIAAAATIFTPAGAPLLIASLFFGGSATAVQTGTEVRNHLSEPNRLADRILALHGMAQSILRVTSTLRDALLRSHIRADVYLKAKKPIDVEKTIQKNRGNILAGVQVSRTSLAGLEAGMSAASTAAVAETGVLAGRQATFLSRTSTGIMRTARFARFASGALSAAMLVFEAKCMTNTIQSIRAGNPCEKAELLRKLKDELDGFPTTRRLDEECENYLQTIQQRERAMTEEEVIQILLEQFEEQQLQEKQLALEEELTEMPPANEYENETDENARMPCPSSLVSDNDDSSVATTTLATSARRASLLERIETFKGQQHQRHRQTSCTG